MEISPSRRSILFVVGDLSGNSYTSRLAERLAARHPDFLLHALAGRHMGELAQRSGGVWVGDSTNCSAIGICSVLRIYFRARQLQQRLRQFVQAHPVDLVVLCDWGGFNCQQLDFFQQRGIPTLYYFPPRSWQRSGSAGIRFARHVTRVATPFAWSAKRLTTAGCRADWVGHPLLESPPTPHDRNALRKEFGVDAGEELVALLPGSRASEIRVLGPRLARVAARLARERASKFVVAVPPSLEAMVRPYYPPGVRIAVDRAADVLRACDVAIVKTGSATLEAVVADAPQVTIYDLGWMGRLEWVLLWMWKHIPFIAMPNIILERRLVPELLGLECRTESIVAAVRELLENPKAQETMRSGYTEILEHLGRNQFPGATEHTITILEEMLGEAGGSPIKAQPTPAAWLNRSQPLREAVAASTSHP